MEPKFKIGDKVRIKNKTKIFTITEIPINPFSGEIRYFLNNSTNTLAELELELEEPRKIIGYKVPFDMYGEDWKKGDTVIINALNEGCYKEKSVYTIPKEIAETWELVYEEIEQPKTIFERVNSFEDACKELGKVVCGTTVLSAYSRLKVICKALNEGWVADWDDHEQNKWRFVYNTTTKELFIEANISLLEMPKSLYLKSEALTEHLIKIAEKELLEFFNN